MTNKYKSVIYNKILLLSMDIETAFGDDYVIEKMYVYFNKNFVEGKYIKPYAIKFILNQLDPDDSNRKILQSEEYKYSLEDIYDALGIIPLYLIKSYPKTNYGFVDINDNVYPISDVQKVSHLKQYEDDSYEFEVRNGSIIINELVIAEIENILKENKISYEIINEPTKKYISVYGIYKETEPSYKINISLDGKSYDDTGYCITPEPIEFKPYTSIGKFRMFNKRSIGLPNDEHLALITKCSDCGASIICDWLNLRGTYCPYCHEITKL